MGISGLTAGVQPDSSVLKPVKQSVPKPAVFANTGLRIENVAAQVDIADGGVADSTFKQDGFLKILSMLNA